MFSFKSENVEHLHSHNITIRELPVEPNMSVPRQLVPRPSTSGQRPGPSGHGPRRIIHLPQIRMLARGRPSGIRIVNVKSIKPPDPAVVKKSEEEKLRAQLSKEIEWKSRLCAHREYECILPVLTGRLYCSRHILQDATAPFRQCSHVYGNGKRCPIPTPTNPQTDKRDMALCFEHARLSLAARQRSLAPPPPAASSEALLLQLRHYVTPERVRTTSCASSVSVVSEPGEPDAAPAQALDPFKQIDAIQINNSVSSNILECCSETDSEGEGVTLGKGGDVRASEDSLEDLEMSELRLAGVYTAEEVVSEARTALKTLQSAYIKQMGRLRTLLQAARFQYLKQLKTEKEQCCSINSQARTGALTMKERHQLKKLKAYASFHRRHGVAAALMRKLQKRRAKVKEPPSSRPVPSQGRCTFSEYNVRCAAPAVPSARHCHKHILQDKHQVLFSACGDSRGGDPCREPVPRLPHAPLCVYHTNPPPYTTFTLKKENSDSESDASTMDASEIDESAGDRLPDLSVDDRLPDLANHDHGLPDLATDNQLPDLATDDHLPDLATDDHLPDLVNDDRLPDLAGDDIEAFV